MHGSASRLLVPAALLALLLAGPGCSRKFFRERADADVAGVITQKNHFPDWAVKNWFVYPHPDSRFADPFNPDRPPYPADDYAARLLSPNPQHPTKKTGTGRFDGDGYIRLLSEWDAENRAEDAARGAPPDRLILPRPAYAAKPQVAGDRPPAKQDPAVTAAGAWEASPSAPAPPPAIRPPAPPGPVAPAATPPEAAMPTFVPAKTVAPATPGGPATPVPPATPVTPVAAPQPEVGPWIAVKPQITVSTETPSGPKVAEVRTPAVVPVSGQAKDDAKPVPAAAVAPTQPPTFLPDVVPTPPVPTLPAIVPPPPAPPAPAPRPAPAGPGGPAALPVLPIPQPPEKLPVIPQPVDPRAGDPKAAPGQFPSVDQLLATGSGDEDYLRALESNQQGFRIKLEQAVGLGLVNSREFQDRREDLYLAALPVTLERYNFAAQAFFTEQVVRDSIGSSLPGAGQLWRIDTTTGFAKNFATGASLLVRLANQVVIDLGSGRPDVAVSNLGLSFVQPLLRGGGFAVNLEALTSAERNMVYAMRSYARFRKIFYVGIAAGGNITNNPYGLQGLSVNLGRGIGGNLTAPNVGFLPLLQQAAVINNQRKNVAFLERLLDLYRAFREGGQQSDLQVGQVEVNLLNSRAQLLGQGGGGGGGGSGIRGYLDQLDNFKLQLGLPVTVGLDPENSPLKPIRDQLARFEDLYADLRALEAAALRYNPNDPNVTFRGHWRRLFTDSELVKGTAFAKGIGARWDVWAKLPADQLKARLDALALERNKLLDEKTDRQVKKLPDPPAAAQRLADVVAEFDLAAFELAVREYEAKTPPAPGAFQGVSIAFYRVVLGARDERVAETRSKWPKLAPLPVNGTDLLATDLDCAYTAGIQAALTARLDLMNARGQVVDAYRNIAVQANSLQGVFDVGYDLSASTPAGESRPFAFSSDRSRHTLTLRAELPLVRRAERNNYRAALVSYQRQRRTLMAFEDNIANDVRGDIRELRTLAQLYRIQQRVVELGYSQVDNAQAVLLAPPPPPAAGGGGGNANDAGNAAALTQQVLQAQSSLLQAQNNLYGLWVSYTTARMNLYLDLELMQLDDRGVWCDEQATGRDDSPRPGPEPRPAERLPAPRPAGPADRK